MKKTGMRVALLLLLLLPFWANAELARLDDADMAEVSGQGGIFLSGEVAINENGGPIQNTFFGDCTDNKRCGGRLAIQFKEDAGWLVLDDFKGKFSFEGLTLRVRTIDSGFGGDGALFNREVVEIGLPNVVRFDGVQFGIAASSTARPSDPNFEQTKIFDVQIQGDVTLEGNMLVFPTGTP